MIRTAIMIDGAFYIHRAKHIFGALDPKDLAWRMYRHAVKHAGQEAQLHESLYRIFSTTALPFKKRCSIHLQAKQ